jgi:hypothetical protein
MLSAKGKRGPTSLAGKTQRVGTTTCTGLSFDEEYNLDLIFMSWVYRER